MNLRPGVTYGPLGRFIPVGQTSVVGTGDRRRSRARSAALRATAIALWLGSWQVLASLHVVNTTWASSPARVWSALTQLIESGEIVGPVEATAIVLGIGLGVAVVAGIPIGLAMGRSGTLYDLTDPLIAFFNAAPYIAFFPVIIFWFGLGQLTQVLIVVWASLMPVFITVRAGSRGISHDYLRVAAVFGARTARTYWSVIFPATVPYMLAACRLAVGRALVAVVVAEFFVGGSGIGHYILVATTNLNMDQAMAGIAVIAVAALVLNAVIGALEGRFKKWSA